jgi:acetyl-CoA synthetase
MTDQNPTEAFRAARDLLLAHRTDEDAARAAFQWPDVGDHFNWAVDWFDAIAEGNDRLALWIVDDEGHEWRITYDEMRRRSNRVANWLISQGVQRGDSVMIMLDNRWELWEAMLGVMKAGAVILPTSVVLTSRDLAERVERAQVKAVITDGATAPRFDDAAGAPLRIVLDGERPGWVSWSGVDAAPDTAPDVVVDSGDPCIIYFTSGTTSKSKMVVHTQLSYPVGHLSTMFWIGMKPDDVHLAISAPGWGKHAWSCFFAPWIAEATVFVYNYRRFQPEALVEQLDRAHVNTFCAPPTVWRMLIQHDIERRPGELHELLSAGEPLNPEVIDTIRRWWGLEIRDGYGQTELTATIGNPPGTKIKVGAMGRPLPGNRVELLDPVTGRPTDEGEICLPLDPRPLNLMDRYLGDPEKTRIATRDGYYHTSDVAVRDADGCYTFIGRTDDVFKSSDFKISPFEVESALIEHPAVAEAGVVGAPHETRLNIVKAYVALAAGFEPNAETARDILTFARHRLPAYMRVRRLEFFPLPKTASGKIRRVELRDREALAAAENRRLEDEYRDDELGVKGPSAPVPAAEA